MARDIHDLNSLALLAVPRFVPISPPPQDLAQPLFPQGFYGLAQQTKKNRDYL